MAYRYYESINQEIVSTSDANTISRNTIPKIDFVGDLDNAVLDNVNVVYCVEKKTLFVRLAPGTGFEFWETYGGD